MDVTAWTFLYGAGGAQLLDAVDACHNACLEQDQHMDMPGFCKL